MDPLDDPVRNAKSPATGSVGPLAITPSQQRRGSQSSIGGAAAAAMASPSHPHRQSFAENQRHPPPSPRTHRNSSFTQQALQDLLNHPPGNRHPNPRYTGRDWRHINLGELAEPDELKWVDWDTSIEDATHSLLKSSVAVALIRHGESGNMAASTFDYNDLNAYLLVVVGLAKPPDDSLTALYPAIAAKAQARQAIPLRDLQPIWRKTDLNMLPADSTLERVVEAFGSGIHRVLITNNDPATSDAAKVEVIGVLSQLRLLEFFWNEGVNFPEIEQLYGAVLRDLRIGTKQIIAVNADAPLSDALVLMSDEGLTSVAVVDNGLNVVGNISTADVRHLTSAASASHLLQGSCMHFVSFILTERGVEHGRDSFPVFYVSPQSSLAHTVAKLVATHSHRMWIVEPSSISPSPGSSTPATPQLQPAQPTQPSTGGSSNVTTASAPLGASPQLQASSAPVTALGISGSAGTPAPINMPPPASGSGVGMTTGPTVLVPTPSGPATSAPQSPVGGGGLVGSPPTSFASSLSGSVPAAAMAGAHLSGKLTGVVSLTDILNLFARSSGLHPSDPAEQRARRRRSSSLSVRPSLDGGRGSMEFSKR